jgi:hypothetical protein
MRDLEHIAPVLDRVLDEASQLELKHAKPRALDAVSRAREASYQVRTPQAPVRIVKRSRMPAGSVARGTVCPHCDCAATKQGQRIECVHCGNVTIADAVTYAIVDTCRLADGRYPEQEIEKS